MDISYSVTIEKCEIIHLIRTKDVKIVELCLANLDVNVSQIKNEYEITWRAEKVFYKSEEFIILLFENTMLPILSFIGELMKVTFKVSNVGYELNDDIKDFEFDFRQGMGKYNDFVFLIYKSNAYETYRTKDVMVYAKVKQESFGWIQQCMCDYSKMYGSLEREKPINVFFVEDFLIDGISWRGNIVIKERNIRNYFVVFHELAHQWFNWSWKPSPYWLVEAMADFSSNYILNQSYNMRLSTLLKRQRENYAAWLIYHEDIDLVDCNKTDNSFEREAVCHGKAAFFLVNLERELGMDFFSLIRQWLKGVPFWECCKTFLQENHADFIKQWATSRNKFEVLEVVRKQSEIVMTGLDEMLYPLRVSVMAKNGEKKYLQLRQKPYNVISLERYSVDIEDLLLINFNEMFYLNGYLTLARYRMGIGDWILAKRILRKGLKVYPNEPILLQMLVEIDEKYEFDNKK